MLYFSVSRHIAMAFNPLFLFTVFPLKKSVTRKQPTTCCTQFLALVKFFSCGLSNFIKYNIVKKKATTRAASSVNDCLLNSILTTVYLATVSFISSTCFKICPHACLIWIHFLLTTLFDKPKHLCKSSFDYFSRIYVF